MTDIELIKSKLDIVDVIQSYIPELKKAGANYKANCPFHNEKTPSFTVNPALQIYKCFGCGKGGDVVEFIKEIEKVEFGEALRISAEKAGVQLTQNFEGNKKNLEEIHRIIEANTLTAKYYHYILQTHASGKPGRDYSKKRQIDAERMEKFIIGYAPAFRENLKKFLISKGFNVHDLIKWGLLVEREGKVIDKFRQRLMQPIFNLKGEVVGFSGRYIGSSKDAPKYLNSPETLVYKKNELLYGLYQAKDFLRENNYLIIVEGNIDILSSHRVGVGNIVAPLGTAFTLNQAKLVKRFAEEIYFCFDTDNAGMKALTRGLAIVEEIGLKHKVIDITGFQDADELIIKNPEEWEKRIKKAKNTVEYLIFKFSEDLDLGSADGKLKFNARIIPIIKTLKDEVMINHFSKQVAVMLEVSEDVILERIKNQKFDSSTSISMTFRSQEVLKSGSLEGKDLRSKAIKHVTSETQKLEIYMLSLLVQSDSLFKINLEEKYFIDGMSKEIYQTLIKSGEETDFGIISSKLSDEAKLLFENIAMFDPSKITKMEKELQTTINRLYENYLKREILKIRKMVNENIDDETIIEKLRDLTVELRDVSKK